MKAKMSHFEAEAIATSIVNELQSRCKRIEIAGSIRRGKPEVGDIEIVAIPDPCIDMFGQLVPLSKDHALNLDDWSFLGKAIKNGLKFKQIELKSGISLDLFIVTPPAQWGVQFLIRTGPAEYSHKFVTSKSYGGLLPSNLKVKDGAIWRGTELIETPEECDVYKLIGSPFVQPEDRTA